MHIFWQHRVFFEESRPVPVNTVNNSVNNILSFSSNNGKTRFWDMYTALNVWEKLEYFCPDEIANNSFAPEEYPNFSEIEKKISDLENMEPWGRDAVEEYNFVWNKINLLEDILSEIEEIFFWLETERLNDIHDFSLIHIYAINLRDRALTLWNEYNVMHTLLGNQKIEE